MVNILVLNNNDSLLDNCLSSLVNQTEPVRIFVSNFVSSRCYNKYQKTVLSIEKVNGQQHSLAEAIHCMSTSDYSEEYFGVVLASQALYKDKTKILVDMLRDDDIYSYAYSDFETLGNKVFEHPFDLRVIGTGRYPNPFGIFRKKYFVDVPFTENITDLYRVLAQKSLFAHCPASLFIENQNAHNR